MTALNPQITKSYAAGEKDYTMSLVERGSRFSFYVIFIFALPLCLETEFILNLWLKEYPNHTINFVRLILILSLSDILSNTLINLQSATGKIRDYQIVVGGTLMLNFPLSYFALKMNLPPESTLAIAIIISVCCMILRLLFLRKMAGLSVRSFIIHVYTNVLSVVILSSIIPFVIHNMIPIGWERFIITCATSLLCSSIVILFIGCNRNERSFIFSKISIFRKH